MTVPVHPSSMRGVPPGPGGSRVAVLMRTRNRPVLRARALGRGGAPAPGEGHRGVNTAGGDPAAVDALVARHDTGFDGRISVLHQPHALGMEAACNAALAEADRHGAFGHVAVHDDDDTWHPEFLRRTTAFLALPENTDKAAVLTHWTVVRERLQADGVAEEGRDPGPFDASVLELGAMLARNRFPPISLLLRRAVVEAAGPFNEAMPVLGDWDHNLRVLLLGDIGVLPERLAFYHQRTAADGLSPYANTGAERHAVGDASYRNTWLRALAGTDPAALSLIQVLGFQAERYHEQAELQHGRILANLDRNGLWGHARHEDLQQRLVRVEAALERIEAHLLRAASGTAPGPAPGTAPGAAPAPAPLWRRAIRRLRRSLRARSLRALGLRVLGLRVLGLHAWGPRRPPGRHAD